MTYGAEMKLIILPLIFIGKKFVSEIKIYGVVKADARNGRLKCAKSEAEKSDGLGCLADKKGVILEKTA